jgi:hypothetical protein
MRYLLRLARTGYNRMESGLIIKVSEASRGYRSTEIQQKTNVITD